MKGRDVDTGGDWTEVKECSSMSTDLWKLLVGFCPAIKSVVFSNISKCERS